MRFAVLLGFHLIIGSFCLNAVDGDRIQSDPSGESVNRSGGIPLIQEYNTDGFARAAQYWAIVQLDDGEMVFGSHRGVSFYNGHQDYFFSPPGDHVFSLAQGNDGKLYIGGLSEIGHVTLDNSGDFSYSSLNSHIPERYHDYSTVWQSIATDDGIYFRSPEYLFYWDYETVRVWEPETRFNFLGSIHDKILVWQEDMGLYELKDGTISLLPDGEIFAGHFVRALLPYDAERILIGTRTDGFYLYDGDTYERWDTDAKMYITDNVLYNGSALPDGSFAFGTLQGGVVVVERDGAVRIILDRLAGLSDQSVLYTYIDQSGSLWLGLQTGLSRVEPMLPVTRYDDRTGIEDLVHSFIYHDGIYYAGTNSGVYKFDPQNTGLRGYGNFRKIRNINSAARYFTIVEGSLLAATDEGIFSISDHQASPIYSDRVTHLLTSGVDDRIVYAAQQNNIMLGRYANNEFAVLSESGRIPGPINCVETDDGTLYVGTRADGVYRLQWDIESALHGNNRMLRNAGRIDLPAEWESTEQSFVYKIIDTIRVATYRGLYKISTDHTTLIPDSLLSSTFAGGGRDVYKIDENDKGEIFFRSLTDHFVARPTENGEYNIEQGVLNRIKITQLEAIYNDPMGNVWFGGSEGLYRYDSNINYDYTLQLNTLISDVYINADSLLYRGLLRSTDDITQRILPYTENDLRFIFSIPAYGDAQGNRYQTKLEPIDEDWSRWTDEWFKDYTNLREGRYRFMVRGRDVYGNVSEAATFEFRVLPPWYRTWWAYGMSGLFIVLILLSIHKYRVNRLLEVERTRTRIARDLHDDIGSSLSSIALMIDMVSNKVAGSGVERKELDTIGETAREMVDSLRDVVWVINPDHDKFSTLIDRMKSTAGNMLCDIDYSFNADVISKHETVSMDFKRSVLMIYKEALNNIIKHARATKVNIVITETDGLFQMRIEDNGIGFEKSKNSDGNGLQNMQFRTQQIHGNLLIQSAPGKGTSIELKAELM